MFLNEQIRRCVTFLYEDVVNGETEEVERIAVGTAFIVTKAWDDSDFEVYDGDSYPDCYSHYLVTAAHVVNDSDSDILFVRLNRDQFHLDEYWREGPYKDIPIHKTAWVFHPKENTTDVAAYRLEIPPGHFTVKGMPFTTLTTKIYTARKGIGAGDEVFYVGLFRDHPGMERVEPVIRFGYISLMLPFEQVRVELSKGSEPASVEAYLVEVQSYGGESGAPVMLYWPPIVRGQREAELALRFRLPLILGLIQGGFNSESGADVGIAAVIPADKIRETIVQKKLADERKKLLERNTRHKAKATDEPSARPARRDLEFTPDDMTDTLKKVIPRPSQTESGSDEI